MKKIVLMFFFTIMLFSCKKDTFSSDGYYSGSFSSQEQRTFTAIVIDGSNYSEVPSGGVYNQKYPCVTKGKYRINNNTISFYATVLPVVPDCQCGELTGVKFDCLLIGDYTLVQSGEKIIFQRGTGNDLQVYDLTLIEPIH
jgi:hypothetical protein